MLPLQCSSANISYSCFTPAPLWFCTLCYHLETCNRKIKHPQMSRPALWSSERSCLSPGGSPEQSTRRWQTYLLTLSPILPLNLWPSRHLTSAATPFLAPHTVILNNWLLLNCLTVLNTSPLLGYSWVLGLVTLVLFLILQPSLLWASKNRPSSQSVMSDAALAVNECVRHMISTFQ